MKCPHCEDQRNSSGDTFGPRKVWVLETMIPKSSVGNPSCAEGASMGTSCTPPKVQNLIPSSAPFVHPPLLRMQCLKPPCENGTYCVWRRILKEQYIIGRRPCTMCDGLGFIVIRYGQGVSMQMERSVVPFAELAKVRKHAKARRNPSGDTTRKR